MFLYIIVKKEEEVFFMNRLKQLRLEKNITQEELAFQLHTSQQRISKLERHLIPLNEDMIESCVKIFGVTADYLLGISDVQVEIELDLSCPRELPDVQLQELLYYFGSLNESQREMLLGITKVIANESKTFL